MEAEVHQDHVWVQQTMAGNTKAYGQLVKKYERSLLRVAFRYTKDLATAEDVVQEAFMKAYEKLDTLQGKSSFKSWLFQIGVNCARNKLRDRREVPTEVEKMRTGAVDAAMEQGLDQKSISKMIQEFVATLPERQRLSMELRVFEDLSFKEIAQIMGCPYDTAKANFRHAVLKLKEFLESELSEHPFHGENWQENFQIPREAET